MKESDLAKRIMKYLKEEGWDCYPEAQLCYGRGRADIACIKKGVLWVIETKTNLSLRLLDQANEWVKTKAVHRVSLAIPYRNITPFAYEVCNWKGLGILMATPQLRVVYDHRKAPEHKPSTFKLNKMVNSLHPDMKKYAPGTTKGYSTPYNRTMKAIRTYLKTHPGASLKDILKEVPHHYASKQSASACIPKAIKDFEKGKINGRKIKNRWRFYAA